MLCAYLIAKGATPDDAIKRVRAVERSAVETKAQIEFLIKLPDALRLAAGAGAEDDFSHDEARPNH
jgi:protein-tyrosine phosphatase